MKKRLISIFLTIALVVGIIPFGSLTAFAANRCTVEVVDNKNIIYKNGAANEKYSLVEKVKDNAAIVTDQKKEISQMILLEDMNECINLIVESLDIASHALIVNGKSDNAQRLKDEFNEILKRHAVHIPLHLILSADISGQDFIQAYKYMINSAYVGKKTDGKTMATKILQKVMTRSDYNVMVTDIIVKDLTKYKRIIGDAYAACASDLDHIKSEPYDKRRVAFMHRVDSISNALDSVQKKADDFGKQYAKLADQMNGKNEKTALIAAIYSGLAYNYGRLAELGGSNQFGISGDASQIDMQSLNDLRSSITDEQTKIKQEFRDYLKEIQTLSSEISDYAAKGDDQNAVLYALIMLRTSTELMEVYFTHFHNHCRKTVDFSDDLIKKIEAIPTENYLDFFSKDPELIKAYLFMRTNWPSLKALYTENNNVYSNTIRKHNAFPFDPGSSPESNRNYVNKKAAELRDYLNGK